MPHFVLGLGIYIAEMATRKDPMDRGNELVSSKREVLSEAAKLFSQLGFSNLMRAMRVRYLEQQESSGLQGPLKVSAGSWRFQASSSAPWASAMQPSGLCMQDSSRTSRMKSN
jgi:hypothetical protein